jgi:TRAP-type C4-dicarboxylate transport system permease small subunit
MSQETVTRTRWRTLLEWPFEEFIAGLALVMTVGSVLWGVLTRYLFPQPAAWSYEVATIGFAWLVFFGAAAGIRHRLHSDIDILVGSFTPRWQYRFEVFNFWLLALFFGSLCLFFIMHVSDAHKSLTIALNLPRSVIYVPVCLATAMMLLRHIQAWFRRHDPNVETHEANIT